MRLRVHRVAFVAAVLAGCSSGGDDVADAAFVDAASGNNNTAQTAPSALFVLGDSLSDVGNAAGAADYLLNLVIEPPTVGLCNPSDVLIVPRRCDDLFYEQSRVSDGAVAVEHVAASFGLGPLEPSLHILPSRSQTATNYAVASAKARGQADEDLGRQVDWLLLDHSPLPTDALYVVMIGGNDAIDALQADVANAAAVPRPSAAIVTAAVSAIRANVERLLVFGARRVVVANVPDLSMLPAVREEARRTGNEAAVLAAARAISDAFDRQLDAALDSVEQSVPWRGPAAPVIARFDLRAALVAARATIATSGGNANDSCFDSEAYRSSGTAVRTFHHDCMPETADRAPRFDEFAFWDGIHPTGSAHAAIGGAMRAVL